MPRTDTITVIKNAHKKDRKRDTTKVKTPRIQEQQLLISNVKQECESQQKIRRQLLRLRPHTTPSTRNIKYNNDNTNIMINSQVVRGNNYSLPLYVSQEDKASTEKKRFIFQKRMHQIDKQKKSSPRRIKKKKER